MKDILIKNGNILTSTASFRSDIFLSEGIISDIGENPDYPDNTVIIDASDKYIIPAGIDAHVHMHLLTPVGFSSDNFETGSIAALYGGTTTIIDFITPSRNESLIKAVENRMKEALYSKTDYALHASITSWNKDTAREMELCVKQYGITSFKTYMAYKGAIGIEENELFEVMKTASKLNALIMVHCELGNEITALQNKFITEGKTSVEYHPLSRPPDTEAESVKHVVDLAEKSKCSVYIVHTSTSESLDIIKKSQGKEQRVYSETCPQYLLLDESCYKKPFPKSLVYVISPPLREKKHQQHLWDGLKNGNIQVVATDHCPFNIKGQKNIGTENFTKIPNGAGGIEHRLSLLYTYGVLQNRISLNQFVALTSTNPAKILGLYPQKGEIAVGSDADIVIWNPEPENIISKKTHHQNCDSNIFEGIQTKGNAEFVIAKGKVVIEKEKLKDKDIKGIYLFRK